MVHDPKDVKSLWIVLLIVSIEMVKGSTKETTQRLAEAQHCAMLAQDAYLRGYRLAAERFPMAQEGQGKARPGR